MTTLRDLRPKFTSLNVSGREDRFIPMIREVGDDEDGIWFDGVSLTENQLARVLLLVEAAYDLGIKHVGKVIADNFE